MRNHKGWIKPYRVRISVLILVALLSASACNENHIREAKKAAYRIQVVTDASIDTTATLFHDKVIDKAKTKQIATILLKVNSANKVLIDKAEAATTDTPGIRADLIAQFRAIEDAVKELKAAGILGIKSKNGSLAFDSAIAALDSALAIIQATLAGGK